MKSNKQTVERSNNSRGAFTLVEMLIVVALLAVLMTIMFRLGNLSEDESCRTTTITRMQKIENCLSGYYAAYGSYPPVKVHGWREIDHPVDKNGDQTDKASGGSANQQQSGEGLVWAQVEAACRCQPFGCEYPPGESASGGYFSEKQMIENWTEAIQACINDTENYPNYAKGTWTYAESFQGTVTGPNVNGFVGEWDNPDWKAVKLFKFGVMSFLLPRYLFMTAGDPKCFGGSGEPCEQWRANNDMPADPFTGKSYDEAYNGWVSVRKFAQYGKEEKDIDRNDRAKVENIPSQAVCARWMPNLEHICKAVSGKRFFGITVTPVKDDGSDACELKVGESPTNPGLHSPPNGGGSFKNAFVTINDGWEREFYYYSPAPYQTYTVWSAGKDGKTFPPWVDIDSLEDAKAKETARNWTKDDIMQMSH